MDRERDSTRIYEKSILGGYYMSFLKELWSFMRVRKKFWLIPLIIIMLLLGVIIVLAEGSAVTPFIYTLF